ncbi:MAG: ROK family protein [Spirochaetes bacterium]|jgi:predicted NBD/HSP70 family sugar kinase|nr:ROK family protein [Spirochaetota bacterium]
MNRRPLRSYDVRERNEKLVLSLIHGTSGISQSEVANITGLKPPTVFRIFSQLQQDGIIRECSPARPATAGKGRKPAFYCVVPESLYIIGIDFWSGSAAVVVSDFSGEAIYSEVIETPPDIEAEAVMGEISALVRRATESSGLNPEKVLGIGVGAPGIVDIGTGTIVRYPRIPGFDGYGVSARIEGEFGWPVHVHNNTAVLALGEYRYGSAAGHQSVMTFLIRSGVGGAFLQDGRVLTNRGRTVLEVGHMVLDPDGRECASGWNGCLESYLSEGAVEAALRECGFSSLSSFGEALAEQEAPVSEACPELGETARRFAQAVHSLSNLLNPESYLIVSRHRWLSEFLAASLDKYLGSDAPGLSEGAAAVLPQTYEPLRACHGAADLVLDRFFGREIGQI